MSRCKRLVPGSGTSASRAKLGGDVFSVYLSAPGYEKSSELSKRGDGDGDEQPKRVNQVKSEHLYSRH